MRPWIGKHTGKWYCGICGRQYKEKEDAAYCCFKGIEG